MPASSPRIWSWWNWSFRFGTGVRFSMISPRPAWCSSSRWRFSRQIALLHVGWRRKPWVSWTSSPSLSTVQALRKRLDGVLAQSSAVSDDMFDEVTGVWAGATEEEESHNALQRLAVERAHGRLEVHLESGDKLVAILRGGDLLSTRTGDAIGAEAKELAAKGGAQLFASFIGVPLLTVSALGDDPDPRPPDDLPRVDPPLGVAVLGSAAARLRLAPALIGFQGARGRDRGPGVGAVGVGESTGGHCRGRACLGPL